MIRKQILCGRVALAFLTLAGMYSIYWLLFSVWMMAYPFADKLVWRSRLYIWLSVSGVIGLLWGVVVVWLFRRRRRGDDT